MKQKLIFQFRKFRGNYAGSATIELPNIPLLLETLLNFRQTRKSRSHVEHCAWYFRKIPSHWDPVFHAKDLTANQVPASCDLLCLPVRATLVHARRDEQGRNRGSTMLFQSLWNHPACTIFNSNDPSCSSFNTRLLLPLLEKLADSNLWQF